MTRGREGAEPLDARLRRSRVEELRADVHVQAEQLETGDPVDSLDQRRRPAERHAELRVLAAGVDRGVREPGHGRVDADEHLLAVGAT